MKSDQSEFVTVCGRRRVGKTYLVECFFDHTYDFSYVGVTRYLTFAMLSEVTVGVTSKRLVTGLVTLFRGYSLATPWILVLLNSYYSIT